MSRLLFLLLVLSSAVPAYAATTVEGGGLSCTGSLTAVTDGPLAFTCSGDLALSGGVLADDSSILLSSAGLLTLGDISVSAPRIELVGSEVAIGSGVILAGQFVSISGSWDGGRSAVSIAAGATIDLRSRSAPDSGGEITVVGGGDISAGNGAKVSVPASPAIGIGGNIVIGGNIELAGGGRLPLEGGTMSIIAQVPEPESYAMLIAGLGLIGAAARRCKA